MVILSRDGPHKQWLEAEEGGDMHAAYSYALAKEATKIKPMEFGYEVNLCNSVFYPVSCKCLHSWVALCPLANLPFQPLDSHTVCCASLPIYILFALHMKSALWKLHVMCCSGTAGEARAVEDDLELCPRAG